MDSLVHCIGGFIASLIYSFIDFLIPCIGYLFSCFATERVHRCMGVFCLVLHGYIGVFAYFVPRFIGASVHLCVGASMHRVHCIAGSSVYRFIDSWLHRLIWLSQLSCFVT